MRLSILAVGRMKSGPERALVDDYLARFARHAPQLGFKPVQEVELAEGGGMEKEGERVMAKLSPLLAAPGAVAFRMDEHGKAMSSTAFADELARLRDEGCAELAFVIGGAEGHGREVIAATPRTISFGVQTWPHRLVRALLAEQIYRAATLMAGLPYHKA